MEGLSRQLGFVTTNRDGVDVIVTYAEQLPEISIGQPYAQPAQDPPDMTDKIGVLIRSVDSPTVACATIALSASRPSLKHSVCCIWVQLAPRSNAKLV